MILKFRDAHIAKLEKAQKNNNCVIATGERDQELVSPWIFLYKMQCLLILSQPVNMFNMCDSFR